jgi:hypothetical protein
MNAAPQSAHDEVLFPMIPHPSSTHTPLKLPESAEAIVIIIIAELSATGIQKTDGTG